MSKPNVLFILTVDTEEEWDWSGSFPELDFSVRNVFELPAFQSYCQELGVKPTYLVDYAVAADQSAAKVLSSFAKDKCEIGAHLHPWANPPFFDKTTEKSSHVINLPEQQIKQKLDLLLSTIKQNLDVEPRSFRTGRWGINGRELEMLIEQGFTVDSSVYPLYQNEFFSCESAPSNPYWPDFNDTNSVGTQRNIIEIPVTTGFNRSNYAVAQKLHKLLESKPFTWLRLNGLLWHSGLLQKLYLSPELCQTKEMKRLIDISLKREQTVFHMFLHSSSLIEKITGLTKERNAREVICQRIAEVVAHLQKVANVEFCTLQEAQQALNKRA